jgi:MoxR-like ATPase
MLVCLLSDGHLLVEGMPGLAKTTAVKALAEAVEGDFHRIQFTPDLLPSDLIGTDIYRHEKGEFEFRQGPLFHNVLLADEVNRAPAKVQSALLEAMAEHQITVGQRTYPLPKLFMVLATQNPVEQEGTYHLPEAQLDRFLMQAVVTYPTRDEELKILELDSQQQQHSSTSRRPSRCPGGAVRDAPRRRRAVSGPEAAQLHRRSGAGDPQPEALRRRPGPLVPLRRLAAGQYRAGPLRPRPRLARRRRVRRAASHPAGRPEILRHRLLLTFEAEAEGITTDEFINRLLNLVAIP